MKLPKISLILGITFFTLTLIIIEYFSISGYFACEQVGWKEMCGFEIMLINFPMIAIFPPSIFSSLIMIIFLGFLSSLFWGFAGILLGITLSFIKFLFKKIKHGGRVTKFSSLVAGLILLSIVFYFFAVQLLL